MNYFIYIKDILGVAVDKDSFHWSFGCSAPYAEKEQFDKCRIRVFLKLVPDKMLDVKGGRRFSYFSYDDEAELLSYSRTVLGKLKFCYNVRMDGNELHVTCGHNYYRFIRNKYMNIHSIDYIMTDAVMGMLLKNGFATLYASCIRLGERCAVVFGAPNTGKTLSTVSICNKYGGRLISEDIAVTDGERIWGAPWTHTHRKYKIDGISENCEIETEACVPTDVFVIEKGIGAKVKKNIVDMIRCLQRYGLGYFKSPCLTALAYFRDDINIEELTICEKNIIDKLTSKCSTRFISSENPAEFADKMLELM